MDHRKMDHRKVNTLYIRDVLNIDRRDFVLEPDLIKTHFFLFTVFHHSVGVGLFQPESDRAQRTSDLF